MKVVIIWSLLTGLPAVGDSGWWGVSLFATHKECEAAAEKWGEEARAAGLQFSVGRCNPHVAPKAASPASK